MSRSFAKQNVAPTTRSNPDLIEPMGNTQIIRLAVTVEEGARMLGVGRATLYKLVMRGEVGSFTVGRARRIAIATLEHYAQVRQGA